MTAAAQTRKKVKPAKKKLSRKKKILRFVYGFFAFVGLITWWGMQPIRGSIEFGVCRTFAEGRLMYPSTLQTSSIEMYGDVMRVYYTHIDGFGENKLDFVECTFSPDPDTGFVLDTVRMNRVKMSKDDIAAFNGTIAGILKYPPDLIMPRKEDVLKNIQIDPNARKPIL